MNFRRKSSKSRKMHENMPKKTLLPTGFFFFFFYNPFPILRAWFEQKRGKSVWVIENKWSSYGKTIQSRFHSGGNCSKASQTSARYIPPCSLPLLEWIFSSLPVHVGSKRKGNNCILCFCTSFLTVSKRKKKKSLFQFLRRGNEISPSPGA